MDSNIQKLKSRLNIKFEPIRPYQRSHKKIQSSLIKQKSKIDQKPLEKSRSISQIKLPRLPSLQGKIKLGRQSLQDSKSYINVAELREKAKSLKQIPKVRTQSKETINQTITYLMRNQILNVPRIVALLQKNNSEEFIYLKMAGMYEYEACDEREKGANFVTVSRNGMVQNGQLMPLQILVREFQLFKKLSKICFFKHFSLIKFLGKWKEGSKKIRYTQNRRNLSRLLNLNDQKLFAWKIQIFGMFEIGKEGGWLEDKWIHKIVDLLTATKTYCIKRLAEICFRMLEHFELPISDSTDLMNRVMSNLSALSISFEKKLRIEKQCEKFYKLARQLQLSAMQKTAKFILTHLQALIKRTILANDSYVNIVLIFLEQLNVEGQNYIRQKDQILLNSPTSFDIDYTLYYDPTEKMLGIRPSPQDLYNDCIGQIKIFVKEMDKLGFKMVRTNDFKFILKSVFKAGQDEEEDQQRHAFKNFVFGMNTFQNLTEELQRSFAECQNSFQRRIALLGPFLQLYLSYLEDRRPKHQFTYQDLEMQYEDIENSIKYCQKLGEGEYIAFGFLHFNQFKSQLIAEISRHKQKLLLKIPVQLNERKAKLYEILLKYKQTLDNRSDNPASFIKVSEQIETFQENALEYSGTIEQNERIQSFYERITHLRIDSFKNEKKLLTQIKVKVRNFSQQRENNFTKYRKLLQVEKQNFVKKIQSFEYKDDTFYLPQADPQNNYNRISAILQSIKNSQKQLTELNNLSVYFNVKPTFINNLELKIRQYQNLEEIWKISYTIDKGQAQLAKGAIGDINSQLYLKPAQAWRKRVQKNLRDSDISTICQVCLLKTQKLINNMQTIQYINSQTLRQKDLDEINYNIERTNNIEIGKIKCRQLSYQKFKQLAISGLKLTISQIVFKSRKEIEIINNLAEFNEWWKNIRLEYETLDQYPSIVIFGQNLKIRDQIDQYMTMLLNIINSKYGTFVRNQCNKYLKNMNNLIDLLQLAEIHQEKFLSLFPILTSRYAQNQLATQCKRFDTILNKTMKNIKVLIKPTQNLTDGTINLLNNHIKHFDSISKVLAKFLEKKRLKFQRFYFLQDYELLEVLVGIGDQKNVFRMFEGIKGWLVSPDGIKIGVIGNGDENLVLKGWSYKNIQPEMIFKSLEDAIKSNLNSIVRNVLYHYEVQMKNLRQLYEGIPWMCMYAVELILYTKQVELNCFHNSIPLQAQQSLIRQALNHAIVNPALYSNYIILLMHLLHFTEQMRKEDVHSIFDFQWHSFLRYYYEKDGVIMRALSNQIKWGGQYQGIWNLMINTSDIRRAHICVLSSIQYANGVLLQGPSGTGKTQSLKQLARCAAKYCVIFNCSQNVNMKSMSKLLSGLCYTASWLCLDEINRLTLQTMSAIAKQIQTIKNAVLTKKQMFNFMGKDIKLKQGIAIFSTMNPIYLKRTNLTQNIKSCFRIISVSMPEYETILQILLFGLKFYKPRELAQKIANTFYNLSIQLSKNPQYDFGLRAMKFMISKLSKHRSEQSNELETVAKALYEIFEFRLNASDKIVFQKIVQDIFNYKPIENKISMTSRLNTMKQSSQTGIIVFGPVSIKSTLIKQYCDSFKEAQISLFNPNSVDFKYFMGELIHGRWQEGIVEKIGRQSLNNLERMHILILDSTLKSETIQNFNTLLDQSKLLTLPNGSRLKIEHNFKIIMQTPHLNLTSPSTITRCNVIYVNDKDVDTKSLIQAQLPQSMRNFEVANKIRKIYSKLNNSQIRQVGQLSKVILSERFYEIRSDAKDNEALGIEKAVIFAARLLSMQKKIQQFIKKDNSFNIKKSPFHYILSFDRYAEGEFVQISRIYEPIIEFQKFTLKTSQEMFFRWLNRKSTATNCHPVLWKGIQYSGKTNSIIYSLKSTNYLKISLNKQTTSSDLARILLPQMLDKKVEQAKQQKPQLIIYLQNLHMSNDQVSQQVRFMMEHNKIFSIQAQQVVPILSLAFIAQSREFETRQFDRVRRHFSQITIPEVDHVQYKNIYCQILKYQLDSTTVTTTVKNSINIQSDRFCTFLTAVYKNKNENLKVKVKSGPYQAKKVLSRIKFLNHKNCKEVSDFIGYMFEAIKVDDYFGKNSNPQILNQTFLEFYKAKFIKQYETYLKKTNFILQLGNTENPQKVSEEISNELQNLRKDIYTSESIRVEIENILRILQNQSTHYCLSGAEGMGKKTLLRLACKIGTYEVEEMHEETSDKQIRKMFASKLKKGLENRKRQVFIVNLENKNHRKLLKFAQQIAIGFPATTLFEPEETDDMFANIADLTEGYSKSGKSYEEVCQDYVLFAYKYLSILMASSDRDLALKILSEFPSISKQTYMRNLSQFPIESLFECTQKILTNNLNTDQSFFQYIKTQGLPKLFVKIYKAFDNLAQKNQRSNLLHFVFNQFHMFGVVELFCQEYKKTYNKINQQEDNLNKSIQKVIQTSKQLNKLREQITVMEPEIIIKKEKIMKVFPDLEEKKKKIQDMKYIVDSQRKEIQMKKQEIEGIMAQVEKKLAQVTPLLNEANESIQTIKRSDLSEIKNSSNPHPLIKFTMENIVILLNQSQNWDTIRKVLSDASLLFRIKNCHPSLETYTRVKKRIEENTEWTYEALAKISYGSRFLYKWINNVIKYKDIEQQVEKNKLQIEHLKVNLKMSELKTEQKIRELQSKEKDLYDVQQQFTELKNKLNSLEQLMERNQNKLQNAQKISTILRSNVSRWQQRLSYLKQLKNSLITYCINICLDIKIFPSLNLQEQTFIREEIEKIYSEERLTLIRNINITKDILSKKDEPSLLSKLRNEDLKDQKKVMLAYHFYEQPIIIDPDNQASNWMCKVFPNKHIRYVKKSFPGAMKIVEDTMKYGQILALVLDEEIDNFGLEIIKTLSKCSSFNRNLIEYNKNIFHLNPQFILLFYCKSKNPKISLSDSLNHQVINFEITKQSLQQNLLETALKVQKPELYSIKQTIQNNLEGISKNLQEMQSQIIHSLLSNKRNIIEDQSFVNLLNENMKKTEQLAAHKSEEQHRIEEVEEFSHQFNKVCSDVADIFISLKQVSKVNPTLIWQVDILISYFIQSCIKSISETDLIKQDENDELLDVGNIIGTYTFDEVSPTNSRPSTAISNFSISMSRAISEDDEETQNNERLKALELQEEKQMEQGPQSPTIHGSYGGYRQNSLNNSNNPKTVPTLFKVQSPNIQQDMIGIMNTERHQCILQNIYDSIKKSLKEKERKTWSLILALKNEKKEDLVCLSNLTSNNTNKKRNIKLMCDQNALTDGIKKYISKYDADKIDDEIRKVFETNELSVSIFEKLKGQLTLTQILIINQLVCPQKFLVVVDRLLKEKKLNKIVQYEQIKVSQWFHLTDNIHPVLLMMGEDPINMISEYLQRKKYKNATLFAIGDEHGKGLDQHIQKQSKKEGIFIIHNLHIATSFLPLLARMIQQFNYKPPHKNFRLILITSIQYSLPEEIISMCHKFIVEQPSGLRNKVKGFYKKSESYIDHSLPIEHKLTYSLCLMHSLVNEMQKFGSFCWNFPSNFTTDDFISCLLVIKSSKIDDKTFKDYQCNIEIEQIQNNLNTNKIDFERLRYLIGQICYIAKMSDNIDRKKMRIIVHNHFNEDLYKNNYTFWQGSKLSQDPSQVNQCIQNIDEENPKTFGLDQGTVSSKQISIGILNQMAEVFLNNNLSKRENYIQKFQQIKPIDHKLRFINSQIENYNFNGIYEFYSQFLREIDEKTKIFYLRAFSNPRQLFVQVKIEAAIKNNVSYDSIVLMWSTNQKQGSYGISNLTLEGGCLKNGSLIAGSQQKQITLFFTANIKKKDKDPNKGKVSIPLYLNEERGLSIGTYGENINLLAQIYLDSKQPPQSWVIKGTAFVVA